MGQRKLLWSSASMLFLIRPCRAFNLLEHPSLKPKLGYSTKAGQLCGLGEVGEIVLRTPFRTLGYANSQEETGRRFRKNPFREDDQDLVYFTGDLGDTGQTDLWTF